MLHPEPIFVTGERDNVRLEVAMQYNDTYNETILSFVNTINTVEGGTHFIGLKSALTRTINTYATNNNLLKNVKENLSGEDVREGLTSVLSIKVPEPSSRADQGQAWQQRGQGHRRDHRQRAVGHLPGREPQRGAQDRRKGPECCAGPGSGAQGP